MKKLIFIFVLVFGLMSFTSANEVERDVSITNSIQVENTENEDAGCRWRICKYKRGVRISCGPWTYGICLDEVVIKGVK
jgi:hypothetical protein